jgi:hypothetical protein
MKKPVGLTALWFAQNMFETIDRSGRLVVAEAASMEKEAMSGTANAPPATAAFSTERLLGVKRLSIPSVFSRLT